MADTLVGYEAQRRRLRGLTVATSAGGGGAVVVAGTAGSGKSTLCDELKVHAGGVTVIATRGALPESRIAFAGLYDLFDPLRDLIPDLPDPQARALRTALAVDDDAGTDLLAISLATLSLFERAAPLLVIVDDAMWLDRSSQAVLGFVGRRIEERGIALIATERADEAPVDAFVGVDRIELGGLSRAATARLLADRAGVVDQAVADRLWRASGGSPLVLLEAAGALPRPVLDGQAPLPRVLPVGERIDDLYAERLAALPAATRRCVLLVSAGGRVDRDALYELLAAERLDRVDLEPAATAGLIALDDGTVAFPHPLIRSTVYYRASADDRRWAHGALAAVDDDPDRRAWHLADAASGPDDGVAGELQAAAQRALRRAGHAEAAAALERAASLTTDPTVRTERLVSAARSAHASGAPGHGQDLLAAALIDDEDPELRAAVIEARAEIELWLGRPRAARDLLVAEADRVAPRSPTWAARLLADASMPSTMIGEVVIAADLAERAWTVLRLEAGDRSSMCAGAAAMARLLCGDRDAGLAMFDAMRARQRTIDHRSFPSVFLVAQCHALAGDVDAAIAVGERFTEFARQQGAPALLAAPLSVLADAYIRRGRLHAAYAVAQESVQLSLDVGLKSSLAHALAMLARVEAVWGRDDAIPHAREALEVAHRSGAEALVPYGNHAIGLAHLSVGRGEVAVDYLEEAARVARRHGVRDPSVVPWGPDLVEAYVLRGRTEESRRAVGEVERSAALVGTAWARATAARCRGLLSGPSAHEHFAAALRAAPPEASPFEAARTELVFGEHLRRARDRRTARSHLRRARDMFERVGAVPWADRADRELRAAGGATEQTERSTIGHLSPQQLSVALRVAGGATNREVASALYLSPKTVENKLTDIYAKLGVRSRTELAAYMHRVANVPPLRQHDEPQGQRETGPPSTSSP